MNAYQSTADTWQSMTIVDDCSTCFHLIIRWNMSPNVNALGSRCINRMFFLSLISQQIPEIHQMFICTFSGHLIYFLAKSSQISSRDCTREKRNAWNKGHNRLVFINLCSSNVVRSIYGVFCIFAANRKGERHKFCGKRWTTNFSYS